jgi:hypothetical protein
MRRIEELVHRLEEIPDAKSRETAQALMSAILDLHGAGLEAMVEIVFEGGDPGRAAIRRFAGDPLIASLLILHGLHPDDLETRVHQALAKTNSNAELISVFDGNVRVRLTAAGCGVRAAVEAALREALPDANEIIVDEAAPANDFVSLESLEMSAPRLA